MAIQKDGYYYDNQITSYILQFMAIFTGLQVMFGKTATRDEALVSVPIKYGAPDRVVAAILAGNTQNAPVRLPLMSAYKRGLKLDTSHFHGLGVERRNSYVPMGGLVPDDIQVVTQRMPLQCILEMELAVYASNADQEHQIIEQFLPMFNPSLVIQTSDGPFDFARMTKVELINMQQDSAYPIGQDRRIIQSTYTFEIPIFIDTPAEVRNNFVERVMIRLGSVGSGSLDSYEIIGELDAQGIEYEVLEDDDNLKIDE